MHFSLKDEDIEKRLVAMEDRLRREQSIALEQLRVDTLAFAAAKIEGETRQLQAAVSKLISAKITDAISAIPPPPDHTALAASVLDAAGRSEYAIGLINDLAAKIADYISNDRYTITRRQVCDILKELPRNG